MCTAFHCQQLCVSGAAFGFRGCKNNACSISWQEVVKGVPNQGVAFLLPSAVFSVSLLCLGCMWCFVSLFLVVSMSTIDCLERLVYKTTYYVSSGMLNRTHSFTHAAAFATVCTATLPQLQLSLFMHMPLNVSCFYHNCFQLFSSFVHHV